MLGRTGGAVVRQHGQVPQLGIGVQPASAEKSRADPSAKGQEESTVFRVGSLAGGARAAFRNAGGVGVVEEEPRHLESATIRIAVRQRLPQGVVEHRGGSGTDPGVRDIRCGACLLSGYHAGNGYADPQVLKSAEGRSRGTLRANLLGEYLRCEGRNGARNGFWGCWLGSGGGEPFPNETVVAGVDEARFDCGSPNVEAHGNVGPFSTIRLLGAHGSECYTSVVSVEA